MEEYTIQILEKLKEGKSFVLTKDSPDEISDLILSLLNLGIIHKSDRSVYAAEFKSRKYLSKLIELKSWDAFLEWVDGQNNAGQITNNFSGSTIGQVNQSTEKIDINSPIEQKTVHKTNQRSNKKSWIEILAWIVGVIAGIVAIYEFLIKQFLN